MFYPEHTLSLGYKLKPLIVWNTWGSAKSFSGLMDKSGYYAVITYNNTEFRDRVNRPIRALEGLTSWKSNWGALAGYLYSCVQEGKPLGVYNYVADVFGYEELDYKELYSFEFSKESIQSTTQFTNLKVPVSSVGEYGFIPYNDEGKEILFSQLANWDKPRPPQFIFGAKKEILEEYLGEVDFIAPFSRDDWDSVIKQRKEEKETGSGVFAGIIRNMNKRQRNRDKEDRKIEPQNETVSNTVKDSQSSNRKTYGGHGTMRKYTNACSWQAS